jgi:hypothetical protein
MGGWCGCWGWGSWSSGSLVGPMTMHCACVGVLEVHIAAGGTEEKMKGWVRSEICPSGRGFTAAAAKFVFTVGRNLSLTGKHLFPVIDTYVKKNLSLTAERIEHHVPQDDFYQHLAQTMTPSSHHHWIDTSQHWWGLQSTTCIGPIT